MAVSAEHLRVRRLTCNCYPNFCRGQWNGILPQRLKDRGTFYDSCSADAATGKGVDLISSDV